MGYSWDMYTIYIYIYTYIHDMVVALLQGMLYD